MNIIAYGSLMNQKSLERSLERPAQLNRIVIEGYQRIFNAPFDDYAFLNLQPAIDARIEGAYVEMSEDELIKFTKREKGSDLIEIIPNYFAFIWPKRFCQSLPVLQSYIDVCLEGATDLGIDFWQGVIRPNMVVNDRNNPIYNA